MRLEGSLILVSKKMNYQTIYFMIEKVKGNL